MKMKLIVCFLFIASTLNQVNCLKYSEVVDLPQGKVRGAIEQWRGQVAYEYKGIPFAEPPVKSLRYVKPVEPKPWDGIKDTIAYGKSCPQNAFATKFEDMDEDCLYLNVYVNKQTFDGRRDRLRPVLFWIHGGGFQAGSGNEHDAYKGVPLVILEDVVLVTFNYRLGVLGFMTGGDLIPSLPANLGLWDQHFALKWTREIIHRFGGDPDRITIFGQSAGSAAVAYHVLSPQSSGMFKGAIMESGGKMSFMPKENITQATVDLISAFNCENVTDKLSCLQSVPWTKMLNEAPKAFLAPIFGDEFLPLDDVESLKSGKYNDVNLLVGAERDEGDFLICSTYQFAVLKASNSKKSTHGYIHTQAPLKDFNDMPEYCGRKVDRVCHCDEIPFVFGAPLREPEYYDADDAELSVTIMKIWADFARTGKPTKQGPIEWPQIGSVEKVQLIELNNKYVGNIDETTGTTCLATKP